MNRFLALLFVGVAAFAQIIFGQTAPKAILGSIAAFKAEDGLVVVKPDNAGAVNVQLTPETVFQRVEPGEHDLRKAAAMKMTDMALGDRVLVSFKPGTTEALRILVMSATDITKRNETDRVDWNKRGISGIVTAKTPTAVTLKMRGVTGETSATVTVDGKTAYRRYNSDSVNFADAKISRFDEVSVGDQLRARGLKSEDGSKVTAEEVVFGTFVTKAGTITAINPETKELTVAELGTNKPLTVKFTSDSQIKRMPNMAGMMPGRGGAPGGSPAGPSHMPDMSQMLDHMPVAKLDDLKTGEKIVVSSTKGAKPDEITAIMLLGNADMLIQMATVPSGRGAPAQNAGGMGAGGGLQTLDLPSMIMN
jgi:hypothetical protein